MGYVFPTSLHMSRRENLLEPLSKQDSMQAIPSPMRGERIIVPLVTHGGADGSARDVRSAPKEGKFMKSSLARRVLSAACVLGLAVFAAGPVHAGHVNVDINDDTIQDLIDAINDNAGPANGGFHAPSDSGNIYSGKCAYVNGYDARNFYLLLDFKEPDGSVAGTLTLYAAWDVFGIIGDASGDG